MKKFLVTWYENKSMKYSQNPRVRHNYAYSNTVRNASLAFCKVFGNLKKITILSFQELDKNDEPIGEPIVPED